MGTRTKGTIHHNKNKIGKKPKESANENKNNPPTTSPNTKAGVAEPPKGPTLRPLPTKPILPQPYISPPGSSRP
jgi:hypothetical protein